jgi:hypothetical protein
MRIKNYKEFITENVDSDRLGTELEIEGISNKEIDLINKLKRISEKSNVEGSHNIFFEIPIVVGKRSGKDVICNYFYLHDNPYWHENYLVFHVMYNERKYKNPKIYDKEFDFSLMNYFDIKRGVHSQRPYKKGQFLKPVAMKFQFDQDFLEKIYDSASKLNMEWIKKCEEVQKESRDWSRLCNQERKPEISWERQLYHTKCQIFYHKILNVQEDLTDIRRLEEMEKDGEKVYTEKMRKENDYMKGILDDILKDPDSNLSKLIKKDKEKKRNINL